LIRLSKELLRGKSLARTLLNFYLQDIELTGNILDLGSKSNSGSYNRFLKHIDPYKIIFTDWHKSGEGIIKLNLEERFGIEDNKFDFITSFNVLEHIYNYKNVVEESFRILKLGGVYIGQTPFLVNYHADPNDYFRYTHQAIEKMFKESGFVCQKMIYLGFGPLSASYAIRSHIYPKFLRPIFAIFAILLDMVIVKVKRSQKFKYPLGYLYIMKK
jgi:SAM-dependent methyltransferase